MKGIESTTKKILGVETDSSETLLEKQAQKERENTNSATQLRSQQTQTEIPAEFSSAKART